MLFRGLFFLNDTTSAVVLRVWGPDISYHHHNGVKGERKKGTARQPIQSMTMIAGNLFC